MICCVDSYYAVKLELPFNLRSIQYDRHLRSRALFENESYTKLDLLFVYTPHHISHFFMLLCFKTEGISHSTPKFTWWHRDLDLCSVILISDLNILHIDTYNHIMSIYSISVYVPRTIFRLNMFQWFCMVWNEKRVSRAKAHYICCFDWLYIILNCKLVLLPGILKLI